MSAPAPSGVVEVAFDEDRLSFWPFTTAGFPARPHDPINLVFVGRADPRNIRAALLSLDGHRSDFPGADLLPSLGCRWQDAVGEMQAAYAAPHGWSGSAIQLECGDFHSTRFHVRLFRAGEWTLANAHLDVAIPGTASHEVVAWELARRLVVHDLRRSGLLAPDAPEALTGPIHPPLFRQVHPAVLESLGDLRALLLETGSITPRGCLRTAERATVLRIERAAHPAPEQVHERLVVHLDTVLPRPFCGVGSEFLRVQGPLHLHHEVRTAPGGALSVQVRGEGDLRITPVDRETHQPVGPELAGHVRETYSGSVTDDGSAASMEQDRRILRNGVLWQQERLQMHIGADHGVRFLREERSEPPGSG